MKLPQLEFPQKFKSDVCAVWFGRLSRTNLESCQELSNILTNTYIYKMKILRLLTCLLSLLNLQNHIYCQREYSPQLAEYLLRAGRPTVMQHFSTFGETKEDYDAKGSNIVDFVTLKTDLKSSFFSKGRFCQSIESFYLFATLIFVV